MAGVRDPQFWKRFSMAVHMDEEKAATATISDANSTSTSSTIRRQKQEDSWLERHRKKSRRTFLVGWLIALGFLILAAGIVMVFLWLAKVGPWQQ